MPCNPERIDLIEALTAQQERIRRERAVLRTKIEQLVSRERNLKDQEFELQNRIHDVRIHRLTVALPTSASPSPKNFDFLRGWVALHDVLSTAGPNGVVERKVCVETIRRAIPSITDVTIRSHLHRLRKRGFIEVLGGGYRLVQRDLAGSTQKRSDMAAP